MSEFRQTIPDDLRPKFDRVVDALLGSASVCGGKTTIVDTPDQAEAVLKRYFEAVRVPANAPEQIEQALDYMAQSLEHPIVHR